MRFGQGKLIKIETADGFWTTADKARLGKVYVVDLESRRRERFLQWRTMTAFECEVIDARDGRRWAPFPAELLEIGPWPAKARRRPVLTVKRDGRPSTAPETPGKRRQK